MLSPVCEERTVAHPEEERWQRRPAEYQDIREGHQTDEAEEEYEAAEVPEKGAVVQRIRKRCMGVVFMAEAKALYEQKNFEECLKMATEAKFCFRDADDVVKTGETDRFFSRAEGDRIMTNYSPELKDGNYDAAM